MGTPTGSALGTHPAAIPSLAEVIADPGLARDVSLPTLVEYRRQAAHLVADLDAAILSRPPAEMGQIDDSHLPVLTIDEAAARLRTSQDSLYRKWRRLRLGYRDPFDRKIKFTEKEITDYIGRQKRG
jgi:hypothetical protein